MEFGVAFYSVCQSELYTSRFIDSCGYLEDVINWGRQKVESHFIDPFTTILSADLK